jgi:hypothetical protein
MPPSAFLGTEHPSSASPPAAPPHRDRGEGEGGRRLPYPLPRTIARHDQGGIRDASSRRRPGRCHTLAELGGEGTSGRLRRRLTVSSAGGCRRREGR